MNEVELAAPESNPGTASCGRGSPRIIGELGKLGIEVSKSTVEKYRVRPKGGSSPTWKAFLDNHLHYLVSIDFSIVPSVRFEILYVLIVLAHQRRRIVHFNVSVANSYTYGKSAAWQCCRRRRVPLTLTA